MLGYTSILADNISGNVIGLALGTAFRFTFYKTWVFAPHRGESGPAVFPEHAEADAAPAAEPAGADEASDSPVAVSGDRAASSRRPAATAPADAG